MATVNDLFDQQNPFSRGIPERVFWDEKNRPDLPKYWEHMSAEEKDMYLKKGNLWERFNSFLSDVNDKLELKRSLSEVDPKLEGKKGFDEEFRKQADSLGMTPREYMRKVEAAYPKESKKYGAYRLNTPNLGEGIVNPYVPKDRDPNYTGPKPNIDFERVEQAWNNGPTLPHEDTVSSGVQARFLKGDDVNPDKLSSQSYVKPEDRSLEEKLLTNAYERSGTRNLERKSEEIEPYDRWKANFQKYNDTRLDDFDSAYAKYKAAIKHMPVQLENMYRARLDNEVSD